MTRLVVNRRKFLATLAGLALPRAMLGDDADQKATDAAARGLTYLSQRQARSSWPGSWGDRGQVGITSLAALAFADAGRFPGRGLEGRPLSLAIDYVLSQAQPNGLIGDPAAAQRDVAYGHGLATLLLAEARGMIVPAERGRRATDVLARAVRLLVSAQNEQGGWRYELRPTSEGDVSVTVTQLMALRAAVDAGQDVPERVFDRGRRFLLACQVMPEGGLRYQPGIGPVGFPLTAAGLIGLHCCGLMQGPEVESARRFLLPFQTDKPNRPGMNPDYLLYGHYYAALAMRLQGGEEGKTWQRAIAATLLSQQRPDGSWPDSKFGDPYATAMACLILQTPRSCLPLLRL